MPLLRKRSRRAELDSLQSSVLSVFISVPNHSNPPHNVAKRRKRDSLLPSSLKPIAVNNLCEDLSCISTEAGASCLSRLKQSFLKRSSSLAQIAAYLFTCDEVDTGPPLCVAVNLLQARLLHLKDVQPTSMMDKAILELRNPENCACRGQRNGLQALIRFILRDHQSSARDMFTEHFLAILFHTKQNDSPLPQKNERLRLAEHVLSALREKEYHHDEDTAKLQEWVRQASLPTKTIDEDSSKPNSGTWTAELSGLATGRNAWEYLTYGKAEERALISLFKIVPPVVASRVYLECVHSVFHYKTTSPRLPPRAVGCWSRVVILGRRVLDLTCFSDADPNLRRGVQSSLNGVLMSALSLKECHDVAVLLCLIRCMLVPGGSLEECSSDSKDLDDYEIWFKDFVASSHGTTLLTVLKALTELIPLEPLKLLRVNHKVLLLKREHAKQATDYLTSLRARISDLNPTRSKQFLNAKHKDITGFDSKLDESDRIEEEVIRFVLEYSKFRKIPSSLARKMNFHRYYFRTKILKSLLDPTLADGLQGKPFSEQLMNVSSFDECRIDMIKDLAFNRKDKAVTAAEANEAIASIITTRDRKRTVADPDCLNEDVGVSVVTESSSVLEICKAAFEECQVRSNCSDITGVTTNGGALPSVNILIKKIENRWKSTDNPVRGPDLAAELLHGITSALEETGRSSYPELFGSFCESSTDAALMAYTTWWKSHGTCLLHAIRHLLESPTGRKIQKFLQYQMFALLCAGEACLTKESIVSLAMLCITLAKLGGTAALMDIFVISKRSSQESFKDFLSSVVTCLPLTRADVVTISATFALHGVCLYVTLADYLSPSQEKKRSGENGRASVANNRMSFATSRGYRNMLDLLRWISCHPWRLSAFPTDEILPSHVNIRKNAISVITFVSRLLVSGKVPIPHDFGVEQYAHIEERCGWGRIGSVYEQLRKRELAGVHSTRLLCQLALFLAKRSSGRWPSVAWMEHGMMQYAEDTLSCCALQTSNHLTSCDAPQFLERSISSDGYDVGYRLLGLYSRMQCCYFHGYSSVDIKRHLTTTLVPWYWPFSRHLVDYLWDCLGKRCLSWESDQCVIMDNFLVFSSFALHGSSREQVRDVNGALSRNVTMGTHMDDMSSRLRELRKAINELPAFDCQLGGDLGTQVVSRSISRPMLPTALAKAYGSCFVLGLTKKCQLLCSSMRVERVRSWIDQIGTVVDEESICAFLGTSLCVASLLPFTRFTEEYGRCNHVIDVTNDILRELLEGHLRLWGEGRGPFVWTRVLLAGRVVGCDDLRANFLTWLGWQDGHDVSNNKHSLECLPVDVYMGRIYQSMGSLSTESLCHIISIVGHDSVSKCLTPNMLNACRRLRLYGIGTEDLKMSKLSYDALLEHRDALVNKMIAVVIRLLALSRETFSGFGDDAIEEIVAGYTEFRVQVISGVTAKTRCK